MVARKPRKRTFGSVRQLPSGRYQARYVGGDGLQRTAPRTFATKADANVYLATQESDIVRETWKAPKHANITLGEFGRTWVDQRPIKASTRERYRSVWNLHIDPRIGSMMIGDVTPAVVRAWYAELGEHLRVAAVKKAPFMAPDQVGSATQAHAYRLLKAIMNTALEDELVPNNPCRIKGASTYRHAERPTLGIDEIEELALQVPERYKATVYLLAWAGIRLGEAAELRRKDIDLKHSQIRVERAVYPIRGEYPVQTPKSRAGVRTIVLPEFVTELLREHMRDYSPIGPDGLLFPTRSGLCAYNAIQIAISRTLRAMGYENVRVHDLRHSGQLLAATNGATLMDLQRRMGHSTVNAAMAYAHASRDNGRSIAERMNAQRATVVDITTRKKSG
ncbi:MAG: tyrosine-type recombinase/integrase [Actinomycetota bacterium]|nr:tyrosine-type recombinase/integrase [Actinomycetota bacterium]